MRKTPEKIIVMIGPPGVGKNTIGEKINKHFKGFNSLDGDSFISPKGIKRLQNGTWNDSDRREYLTQMAIGAAEKAKQGERTVVVDAMTTQWMREFFQNQVRAQGNFVLAWVLVTREFTEGEIETMVAERAAKGHPMNSVEVFRKYFDAFEPLTQSHFILHNPGPKAGDKILLNTISEILSKVYDV